MAKFRADIDEIRYYPTLGLEVSPQETIDLPADTEAAGLTPLNPPKKTVKPVVVEEIPEELLKSIVMEQPIEMVEQTEDSDAKVVAVEDAAAAAELEGV